MYRATMSSRVLGIDFGTTNTVVAVVMEDGGVEVIANDIGNRMTPSVVHIDPTDPSKHQVGEAALKLGLKDPQNTIRNVKRVLGFPPEAARCITALGPVRVLTSEHGQAVSIKLNGGRTITPEEVVAMILMELKKAAEHHLGETVSKAVIAVPSFFTAAQRQAVRDAAALGDLEVVEIVNETTAAALAYAYDKEFSKTAMIVDVGGGGCCISVVRVENNEVSVLACSTRQPGGENFDARMVDYLKEAIAEEYEEEVADTRSEEILRSLWVGAKVKLSRLPQTNIQTYLPEIETEFRKLLTQTEFNSECSDLFQHITTAINATLKKAQVKANELDDVILVGGSTRIVKLRELILEEVGGGAKLYKAANPDEVVALGAALLGAKCVQIKREVLGLHTYMTILDSEKQETNGFWAHSTPLPVSFAFKSLSMTNCKDLELKQGHETKTLITVCQIPIPLKAESITINTEGSFSFSDAGKNKLTTYLRGCLPEVTLESLKLKMQSKFQIPKDRPLATHQREKFIKELNRLALHTDVRDFDYVEDFDDICMKMFQMLQEECKKEKHRVQERDALLEVLNTAINIKVIKDDFEERATCLRKSCQEEKEWLSKNCHFSSEEYTTRKDKVKQAMTALNEDRQAAIQKLRNQLREHLQQRLRGMIKFATEKKKIRDPLDYQWGTKLETICRRTTMWLKDHSEASEDELNDRTTQLERENNILDGEIQQLKQKRDCERKAAYKNAEQTVLQGVYLKVAEFEAVSSDAFNFVEMCKGHLERLKKTPHMNASDCAKVSTEVEESFTNLRRLCMAEVDRRQRRRILQVFLETVLKDGEPLRTFAQGFLTWLEQHPTAAKEQLEEVMASVRDARGSLQEADKLAEDAVTQRGLATLSVQGMQGIAQKLGLRSTGPPTAQLDKTPVKLQTGGNKLVVMKGVTSLSMGVATPNGLVAVLIPRNTPLPCKVTRTFTTASDNQEEAVIKLCLGEGVRWEDNHILGELTLAVPAAGPKGQVDIDTTFALDAGGVLTVTAVERSSKEEASVTLQCESSLESARL